MLREKGSAVPAVPAGSPDPRCSEAFELLVRAGQARQLARDLDRRGGGFTAHAAELARAKAERSELSASWLLDEVQEATDAEVAEVERLDAEWRAGRVADGVYRVRLERLACRREEVHGVC